MSDRVNVTVKYRLGHSIGSEWERLAMHCPHCGTKGSVWHEDGAGDYYVGETHLCTSCDHTWTIQGPYAADIEIDAQILRQIKAPSQETR